MTLKSKLDEETWNFELLTAVFLSVQCLLLTAHYSLLTLIAMEGD